MAYQNSSLTYQMKQELKQFPNVVSTRDLHLRMIMRFFKDMDYDYDTVKEMFSKHHLVHPDVACQLRKLSISAKDHQTLSSVFVPTEELISLLNRLKPRVKVYQLLAIDGLVQNTTCKYNPLEYLKNLQIAMTGFQDAIGQGIPIHQEVRWTHVQTVRQLYNSFLEEENPRECVYRVLAPILEKNYSTAHPYKKLSDFYVNQMGPFKLSMLCSPDIDGTDIPGPSGM